MRPPPEGEHERSILPISQREFSVKAPGGAAFRVAMIPEPGTGVLLAATDLRDWQEQAVLPGPNSDVDECVFPAAALPPRRCPAATDGEPIALSECPEALADSTSGKCASKGPLSLLFLEGGGGNRTRPQAA